MSLKDSAIKYEYDSFKIGDFIEVTAGGSTIRGASLTNVGGLGSSSMFSVALYDGQVLHYNLNHVDVELLFKADLAREHHESD